MINKIKRKDIDKGRNENKNKQTKKFKLKQIMQKHKKNCIYIKKDESKKKME